MEAEDVIERYFPKINYERANYPFHVLFVSSAPDEQCKEMAVEALGRQGVIDGREMLTRWRNISTEVVATDTRDLTTISYDLATMGLEIETSDILTNHYTRTGQSSSSIERARSDTERL